MGERYNKTLGTSIIYNSLSPTLPDYESIAKICNQEKVEHIKWFKTPAALESHPLQDW